MFILDSNFDTFVARRLLARSSCGGRLLLVEIKAVCLGALIVGELKVRVVGSRSKFEAGDAKEEQSGDLREERAKPHQSKRKRGVEQVDDDASKVDVRHHHQIELTKELQLAHVASSFAVDLRSFAQMLD